MKKYHSIDGLAGQSVRLARSYASGMQHSLRDNAGSLAIHAPMIHAPRTKTKKTTMAGSLLGVDAGIVNAAAGALLGTRSASQNAGALLAQMALGQRIR